MLRTILSNIVASSERRYGVDMSYVRFVIDAEPASFLRLARMARLLNYLRLPDAVWFAVGIVWSRDVDCGPCTQLGVTMAERAGVSATKLRAVLRSEDDVLAPDVRLAVETTASPVTYWRVTTMAPAWCLASSLQV